jgi:hypothetical protein
MRGEVAGNAAIDDLQSGELFGLRQIRPLRCDGIADEDDAVWAARFLAGKGKKHCNEEHEESED